MISLCLLALLSTAASQLTPAPTPVSTVQVPTPKPAPLPPSAVTSAAPVENWGTTAAAVQNWKTTVTQAETLPFASVPYTTWSDAYPQDFLFQGDAFDDIYEPSYLCYQSEFTISEFTEPYTTEATTTHGGATPAPTPRSKTFFLPTSGVLHWSTASAPAWHTPAPTVTVEPETMGTTAAMATTVARAMMSASAFWHDDEMYNDETYTVHHKISIATSHTVNRDFRRMLANVLGLEMSEMRDVEIYEKPNGQKLFVFSLGSGFDNRFCEVYRTLTGLNPWFAEQLGVGGADVVVVREDEQFREDGDDSSATAFVLSAAAVVTALATLF